MSHWNRRIQVVHRRLQQSSHCRLRQCRANHQHRPPIPPVTGHVSAQVVDLRLLIAGEAAVLRIVRHARYSEPGAAGPRIEYFPIGFSPGNSRAAASRLSTTSGTSRVLSSSVNPPADHRNIQRPDGKPGDLS